MKAPYFSFLLSAAFAVSASAADTWNPSLPQYVMATKATSTSITLQWNPSKDDVGVTAYEVFRDGVSQGTAAGITRLVTGLSAGVTYQFTVRARDAAGNWSSLSVPVDYHVPGAWSASASGSLYWVYYYDQYGYYQGSWVTNDCYRYGLTQPGTMTATLNGFYGAGLQIAVMNPTYENQTTIWDNNGWGYSSLSLHTVDVPGSVAIWVYCADGWSTGSYSLSVSFQPDNLSPQPYFDFNGLSSTAPVAASFDASGSMAASGTSITAFAWDFQNDSTTDATSVTPNYTYPSGTNFLSGTITARLKVTASNGIVAYTTRTVSDITPPATPANPRVTAYGSQNGSNYFTITCDPASDNLQTMGYRVFNSSTGAMIGNYWLQGTPVISIYSWDATPPLTLTIRAFDSAANLSAGSSLYVPGSSAPSFTTQPQPVSVTAGQQASFSAVVAGELPPTLQWRKDGVNISGATAATYTIPVAQESFAGTYTVVATNQSGAGTSNAVTLTVNPLGAPTANAASNVSQDSFTAHWSTVAAATKYRLDISTSSNFATFISNYQDRDVGNVSSFSVAGLSAGTTYYYRVRADNAAGPSTNSSSISATPKNAQTIIFGSLATKNFGDPAYSLAASASSSLTVSYTSSNTSVATVAGNTVTIVGAGSTTITAGQAGNATYFAAAEISQTLVVNKLSQTVTLEPIAPRVAGDAAFTITATASSGLSIITYASSNPAVASVSGNTVTPTAAGTTTITATQAGNATYQTASASQTLIVNPNTAPVPLLSPANTTLFVNQIGTWSFSVTDSTSNLKRWRFRASNNTGADWANITGGSASGSYATSFASSPGYYYLLEVEDMAGATATAPASGSITVVVGPTSSLPTLVTSSGFQANWSSATSAVKYRLDVSTSSGFESYVPGYHDRDVGNVTSYALTDLSSITTYYYRVRAENSWGPSGNTVTIAATTLGLVPPSPTAISATNNSTTSFTANWAAASAATQYRIDVSTVSTFTSLVNGFNNLDVGNVTSKSVTGLSSGLTYFFRVRAENEAGTSVNSATIATAALPNAPVMLSNGIANVTAIGLTANWVATYGATKYRLDVSTDNFTSFVPGFNGLDVGDQNSYNLTGLESGIIYYVRVHAENIGGVGPPSSVKARSTLATLWADRNGDGILDEHIPNMAGGYEYYIDETWLEYEIWDSAVDAYWSWYNEWWPDNTFVWYTFPQAWAYVPMLGSAHSYVRSFNTFTADLGETYEIWGLRGIDFSTMLGFWAKEWGPFVYDPPYSVQTPGVHFGGFEPDDYLTSLFYLVKMSKPVSSIKVLDGVRILVGNATIGDGGLFSDVYLPPSNTISIELKDDANKAIPTAPHSFNWQIKSTTGTLLRSGAGTLINFDGLPLDELKLLLFLDFGVPRVVNLKTVKPAITVLDANRSATANLRVAKLVETSPAVALGLNAPYVLNPDADSDRFYIKVVDPTRRGMNPKIAVWTQSDNDIVGTQNQVQLTDDLTDPNALISEAIILVSDDVDDDHLVSSVADGGVGDRTRKARLGDSLSFEYLGGKTGPTGTADGQVNIPIYSQTINIVTKVLKNSSGTPFVPLADVVSDLVMAEERLAQIGVKLNWVAPVAVDVPSGIDSSGIVTAQIDPRVVAADGRTMIAALGTTNSTMDIHVFYVNFLFSGTSTVAGLAIMDSEFDSTEAAYKYNAFIAKDRRPFVLAHEIVHLFSDLGHNNASEINLMRQGVMNETNVIYGRKRLHPSEQSAVLSNTRTTE